MKRILLCGAMGKMGRQVAMLAADSPVKCVYAGGIASIRDIYTIEYCGKGRIDYTIGSALDIFGGSLSYRDIVNYNNGL